MPTITASNLTWTADYNTLLDGHTFGSGTLTSGSNGSGYIDFATSAASNGYNVSIRVYADNDGSAVSGNIRAVYITLKDANDSDAQLAKFAYEGLNSLSLAYSDLETALAGADSLRQAQIDAYENSAAYVLSSSGDTITTGTGADTITGNAGDDMITSGSGADVITGDNGADVVYAGAGADTVTGGIGNDMIFGGGGNDTLTGNSDDDTINGNFGNDIIKGNLGDDKLFGNSGNDTLDGGWGNDIVSGNLGNDQLTGASGVDTLIGGLGDDTYTLANHDVSDVVSEVYSSGGTDTVKSALSSYNLTTNVENLTLTGTEDIEGIGNSAANTLTGNAGNNILVGMSGADQLLGGDGMDTLTGGAGMDTLTGGSGTDVLTGGDGSDTYVLAATDIGSDSITEATSGGTDTIKAAGSVSLASYSNVENATLTGTGADSLTGSTGANVLTGNAAANTITGNGGNDTIVGGSGADMLVGGSGNDSIDGGAGADTITSGGGIDALTGGSGTDTFVIDSSSASNYTNNTTATADVTITDFTSGEGISLSGSAGYSWASTAFTYSSSVTTTVTNIEAATTLDDHVVFFTDGTDGYLYANGAGSGTSFDDTLIKLTDVTSAPTTPISGATTVAPSPTLSGVVSTLANPSATTWDSDVTVSAGSAGWSGATIAFTANSSATLDIDDSLVMSTDGAADSSDFIYVDDDGTAGGTYTVIGTSSGAGFGSTGTTTVTLNSNATDALVERLLETMTVTQVDDEDSETASITITDASGYTASATTTLTDTVTSVALDSGNLNGDNPLVQVTDSAAAIDDGSDMTTAWVTGVTAAGGTIAGSTLTVALSGDTENTDVISFDGTNVIASGGYVVVDAAGTAAATQVVGTYTGGTSGADLVITFNTNLDEDGGGVDVLLQQVIQNITFDADNTSGTDGERTATFTILDGSSAYTDSETVTISVASTTKDMTTGADTGASFTGGTGVDVFSATAGELDSGDVLVGGTSNDRLQAGLSTGENVSPTISGVEVFDLTNTSGSSTVTFTNIDDVTTINVTGNQTTSLVALDSSVATINAGENTGITSVTYASGALGATDKLVGNSGAVNVLKATGLTDSIALANTLTNVHTISLEMAASASGTFDMSNVSTGDTDNITLNIDSVDAGQTVTLTNVEGSVRKIDATSVNGAINVTLDNAQEGADGFTIVGGGEADTVTFNTAIDTTGTDDSVNLAAGTDVVNLNSVADGTSIDVDAIFTTTALEVLNINAASDASITLSDSDVVTTNIDTLASGETATITNDATTAQTVDASGVAGNLIFTNSKTTTSVDDVVKGGDGADTITFSGNNNWEDSDTIDGGSGTDIFIADTIVDGEDVDASTMSNIEEVRLGLAGDATVTNMSAATVNLTGIASTKTLTMTSVAATVTKIDAGDEDLDGTYDDAVTGGLDVTLANAADVTIIGGDGTDTFTFGTTFDGNDNVDGNAGDGDTLTATINASVTPDITDVATVTLSVATGGTYTPTVTTSSMQMDTSGDKMTLIVDGGDGNNDSVTIAGLSSSDVRTVDLDGLTGTATVSAAGSGDAFRIDGASGNDTLTGGSGADGLYGDSGADVISGGAGNDFIMGEAGADTLTGGSGNDVFIYTATSESSTTSSDTITDFSILKDKIDLSALDTTFDWYGTDSFTGGGSDTEIRYGQNGTDTLIEIDTDNDGSADMYITLTGNYTLSASNFVGIDSGATANSNGTMSTDGYTISATGQAATINTTAGNVTEANTWATGRSDVITGSNGADTISSGAGADTVTGGSGVDTFILTQGEANTATDFEVIKDFTGGASGDLLKIDISDIEDDAGITDLVDGANASITAGSATVKEITVTTGGALAGGDEIVVMIGGTFADNATLIADATDILDGGSSAITWSGTGTEEVADAFMLVYSDGTDAHLVTIEDDRTTDDANLDDGEVTVTTVATLEGITSIATGDFVTANFEFIA
uniref:Peptidase M10 serralysin C-terminal domain-containing protein n=1 Tax=Magnetococcus massalia (strain MO-1) TaxID=451514 RepID=A0A1S7LL94_MAGMO|nr:Conserved protein of unknown function [Include 22 repeats of Haemolysin-type calcium-binding region] M2 protein [Candidatus Magnetococcus massalia]